jgi:hypothetical protein
LSGSAAEKNSGLRDSASRITSPSWRPTGDSSGNWRLRLTSMPCSPTVALPSVHSAESSRRRHSATCSPVSTFGTWIIMRRMLAQEP